MLNMNKYYGDLIQFECLETRPKDLREGKRVSGRRKNISERFVEKERNMVHGTYGENKECESMENLKGRVTRDKRQRKSQIMTGFLGDVQVLDP